MDLTQEQLDSIRALAKKATPGIWDKDSLGNIFRAPRNPFEEWQPIVLLSKDNDSYVPNDSDAAYIAAACPQVVLALIARIKALEFDKKIFLKMTGEYVIFRCKIVKNLLAMARHLNLLPDARQSGFFYEDASLDDISDFVEKCLQRLKEAHNRDTLIENLGKEKVQWQETAERLDTAVNTVKKAFEDIRIWMESLCLALGISLGDLKGKATNQVISAAIKKLIHEKAQLEKEADWLALVLANHGCGVPLEDYIDPGINGMSPPAPEHWREAVRRAVEERCKTK